MHRLPSRAISRAGFTLIELMVVLLLISLLIGAAGFMLSSGSRADVEAKSLARRLAGSMEDAKRFRDLHGSMSWIEYDFEAQEVTLYTERPLEEGETLEDVRADEREFMDPVMTLQFSDPDRPETATLILDAVQNFDGKIFDGDSYLVPFDPDGATIGHIVYIAYAADGLDQEFSVISVELNPVTGIATVYEFYKELEEGKVP